jgi:hypothetical protein
MCENPPFQVRGLFPFFDSNLCIFKRYDTKKEKNIPSVQVKNKPRIGESKHAFYSWLNGQHGREQE